MIEIPLKSIKKWVPNNQNTVSQILVKEPKNPLQNKGLEEFFVRYNLKESMKSRKMELTPNEITKCY